MTNLGIDWNSAEITFFNHGIDHYNTLAIQDVYITLDSFLVQPVVGDPSMLSPNSIR